MLGYANRLGVVATSAAFAAHGRSHAQLCSALARYPAVVGYVA